ncbi:MAG TPA: aminoglycoside phosphotransferase family protein [Stackebrandtia sp.]|jgi:aminoglycoside phosphotransferase (APT) family kinase protein|uniref:aminoglycoside phosphotransferase family protein n=1 Tax=Stackebrandtia sp. TaxID=2023065 RepID=UPI002D46C215|nr:aminoglycoside phosphotransferase family protein [Stackebrandtia sp.]HZE37567.1 aminoglycoside phosphotransferase family protein [Stackebrandtia sp.]
MLTPKLHADEVDTDADLVSRLIAEQFPRWSGLEVRPTGSSGTVNAIFRLGADKAVRLPRVPGDDAEFDLDRRWLPLLEPRLPVAVPRQLGVGVPSARYGGYWAVYEWLDGAPVAPDAVGDGHGLAVQIADFIKALWTIDTTDAPRTQRGQHPGLGGGMADNLVTLRGRVDVDRAARIWEETLAIAAWDREPVWLHGDLMPGNLLLRDGRLSAVIDFGVAGVGDPAADLIVAWWVLDADSRAAFRAAVGTDEATWLRGRGWALRTALGAMPYYWDTNPSFVAAARRALAEVLGD